jgi:hypothetical protein
MIFYIYDMKIAGFRRLPQDLLNVVSVSVTVDDVTIVIVLGRAFRPSGAFVAIDYVRQAYE